MIAIREFAEQLTRIGFIHAADYGITFAQPHQDITGQHVSDNRLHPAAETQAFDPSADYLDFRRCPVHVLLCRVQDARRPPRDHSKGTH